MTLWLTVLLPLGAAIVLTVAGGRLTRRLHGLIGAGSIALSFGAVLSMASIGIEDEDGTVFRDLD